MAIPNEIELLKAAIVRAKTQLAMLETSAGTKPKDAETRRRIRKAASRIELLSDKLAKLDAKP